VIRDIKKAQENGTFSKWKDQVPKLRLIDPSVKPSPEDIALYAAYTNIKHHTRSTDDWDCVLYKAKNFKNCLRAGCMINFIDENAKPKWQQYAYILNFDTNKIDYYYHQTLIESREFDDYRPFPEINEVDLDALKRAQGQLPSGTQGTAGGASGAGATGAAGAAGAAGEPAKFSLWRHMLSLAVYHSVSVATTSSVPWRGALKSTKHNEKLLSVRNVTMSHLQKRMTRPAVSQNKILLRFLFSLK